MASKNRKNKVKFKWSKELILLLVAIVAILTVTIVLSVPSAKAKSTKRFNEAIAAANSSGSDSSSSYSYLPENNVFVEIGHDKLVKKIAGGDYVYVLYGSTNSTIVLGQLYNINLKAQNEEIDTVYFYSSLWVEETEDTGTEDFKAKQNKIEDEFNQSKSADVDAFTLLEYPAFLVFHEGKLIFNSQSYKDIDAYNWNMYIQKALLLSKNNE